MKKKGSLLILALGLALASPADFVAGLDGVADSSTMADVAGSGWTTESGSTVRTFINGAGVSGLIGSARNDIYTAQYISTDSLLADTTYTLDVRAGNWSPTVGTGTVFAIEIGYDDGGWVSLTNKSFTLTTAGEITPTTNGQDETLIFTTGATVSGNIAVRVARTGTSGSWGGFDFVTLLAGDLPPPPPPGELILLNGDFEEGANAGLASNWTGNAYYEAGEGLYVDGRALSMKDGTSAQQAFNIDASVHAGNWTFSFDKGFRDDFYTGSATVQISLIDAVDGTTVFASDTFDVSSSVLSTNTASIPFTADSVVLDMSAVTSTNGVILRFENITDSGGTASHITALVDNLVLDAPGSGGSAPAKILGITSVGGHVIRIVIDAPGAGTNYWPKAQPDLAGSSWAGVPHSLDGSAPWQTTNLAYVAEFESGTNEVIYVQADLDVKFFGVGDE